MHRPWLFNAPAAALRCPLLFTARCLQPFCVGCCSVLPLCVAWSSALAARLVASRWSSAATPLPAAALSRCPQPAASCSVASPGQQQLSHHGAPASSSSVTVSTASSIFPMALRCSAPASLSAVAPLPASPPQRPCQQQTSFGGEEYSGLASNLAHLGRIC